MPCGRVGCRTTPAAVRGVLRRARAHVFRLLPHPRLWRLWHLGPCKLQKATCELWTFAGLFVLEKDEGFLPGLIPDLPDPVAEVRVTVIGTTQADVAPLGRGFERNSQLVVCIRQTKTDVVLPQKGKDLVVEPRLVPELQRRLPIRRQ